MDAWCARRGIAKGAVLPASQVSELGKRWYAGRMERDWRRRSPDEMEAVLRDVGLTSGFWRLR